MPAPTLSVRISRATYRRLQTYLKRRNLVRNVRHFLDAAVQEYLTRHA